MLTASEVALRKARSHKATPALILAAALAGAAVVVVPRGLEAQALLIQRNEPVRVADRAPQWSFTPERVERELAIATGASDAELGFWVLGALLNVFGFVAALKSAAENATLRAVRHRKARRQLRFAAMTARG